jgi:16S rRNA (guanine1516-N2)-methyltransferase
MNNIAVLTSDIADLQVQVLAEKLALPLGSAESSDYEFFLAYREGCLKLLDRQTLRKGGLSVEIDPRPGEQHSYPAPKKDLLAQAVGKRTISLVDATTGWAQDSLALFRMGYQVTCIERSPVMAALIEDGFQRLALSVNNLRRLENRWQSCAIFWVMIWIARYYSMLLGRRQLNEWW